MRHYTVDAGSSGPASPYEWLFDVAAAPYNDLSPAIPIAGDEDNLPIPNLTEAVVRIVKDGETSLTHLCRD